MNYIDGFIFPISKKHLDEYKQVSEKIALIWKEHGALAYHEFVGDDMNHEGTGSFLDTIPIHPEETIIFGWVSFPSKHVRDKANEKVPADPRMAALVAPLIDPNHLIFNASKMLYGGFTKLI